MWMINGIVMIDSTRLTATVDATSCWSFPVPCREASIIGTEETGNATINAARTTVAPVPLRVAAAPDVMGTAGAPPATGGAGSPAAPET